MRSMREFLVKAKAAQIKVPTREVIVCIVDDSKNLMEDFKAVLENRPNIKLSIIIPPPAPDISEIAEADIVLLDEDLCCPENGSDIARALKGLETPPMIVAISDQKIEGAKYHFSGKRYLWEKQDVLNDFVALINDVLEPYCL